METAIRIDEVPDAPSAAGARRASRATDGVRRVWLLNAAMAALAVALTVSMATLDPLPSPVRLPWWFLFALFALAELGVVHFQFRRDAHSFSMSEIPLVLGLYFASPLTVVLTQLAANLTVLLTGRRQPPLKLVFNLLQFTLQTIIAIGVFRTFATMGSPWGPAGWIGAIAGGVSALIVADALINMAIRFSGGRIDRDEMLRVLGLGVLASVMNASLGLVAVTVMWADPRAVWLALAPPVVLYMAYRAYVNQLQERSRLAYLYDLTRILHRFPQLESGLAAAARHARDMFEAGHVAIIVAGGGDDDAYRTSVGSDGHAEVMAPMPTDAIAPVLREVMNGDEATLLDAAALAELAASIGIALEDGIAAPLRGTDGPVGAILVANRLSDVSTFTVEDAQLLGALAGQIAVSLENGRLEDSLAELTALKERLEELVRSKDEFVAAVSHELRTPLTAVFGMAQELRVHRPRLSDGEVDELIEIIAGQSTELSNIVEDLLVGARADIGTLVVKPEIVDVCTEVEAVIALTNLPPDRSPPVVVGTAPAAMVDPLRLRQIVRNMVTNAGRYGGPNVVVQLGEQEHHAVIEVIDDGDGVPADQEHDIFEPYHRAHNAATQPASVGLGLSVSRQLARLMGGELTYSRRDARTVFRLTVPRADAAP